MGSTSDRDALLRAVCENPDDDVPRLVFADWLEEHGEPERAEFIRLQCAFQGPLVRKSGPRPAEPAKFARLYDLLTTYKSLWLRGLPVVDGRWQPFFHRGFISRLELRGVEPVLGGSGGLFAATPVSYLSIWAGDCTKSGNIFRLLFDHAPVRRLRFLDLGLMRADPERLVAELDAVNESGVWERTSVRFRVEGLNSRRSVRAPWTRLANKFARHGNKLEVVDFDPGSRE